MTAVPRTARPTTLLALALAALVALAACTSRIETRHRDWSNYTGPGARYFQQEQAPFVDVFDDPLEPTNRRTTAFNDALMLGVVRPIGWVWRHVFPKVVRTHLAQAGSNLAFPRRALNDVLQGKWGEAGTETSRFVVNSTVGLLGLFDPAASWGLRAPLREDTGQTFETWGWNEPTYLVLPAGGPSTTRDTAALPVDTVTNIAWWIGWPALLFFSLNDLSDQVLTYDRITTSQFDPYTFTVIVWSALRRGEAQDFQPRPGDGGETETLQAVFIAPRDPDFGYRASQGEVTIPSTGRTLPYCVHLQPEPAPIVYVVPGLGTHRVADHALALAESAWLAGFSVVTISSALNFEFMQRASTAPVPGYAPVDAADVHVALDLVDRQLRDRCGDCITGRVLLGLSLGALHTLYIAADEARGGPRVDFDRYVPVAPPVSLEFGLHQLDAFYNAPLAWPEAERDERVLATVRTAVQLAENGYTPGKPFPFSDEQARYLIGLAFKYTLMDVVFDSQQRHDMGVLLTPLDASDRRPALREIAQYSYTEYFYAFVLPWLAAEHGVDTAEEAFGRCDLRSLESELRRMHPKIRAIVNRNDFLRTDEQLDWLVATLGEEHTTVNDHGGHLGNGWDVELRDAAFERLMRELRGGAPGKLAP